MAETDKYAAALEPALTEAAAELERAEAEAEAAKNRMAAARDKRQRIEKAIALLKNERLSAAGRPKKKRSSSGEWQPSEEFMQRVLSYVTTHPDGVTGKDVVEGTGMSQSTADRCLRVLRRDEQIRLAGKRRTALVYKPLGGTTNNGE